MDAFELDESVNRIDWPRVEVELDANGSSMMSRCLDASECRETAASYDSDVFRSRVIMERHGFGRGEYRYFAYPLPPLVAELREAFYARLAPIANRWNELLGIETRFPATHRDFLARCHAAMNTANNAIDTIAARSVSERVMAVPAGRPSRRLLDLEACEIVLRLRRIERLAHHDEGLAGRRRRIRVLEAIQELGGCERPDRVFNSAIGNDGVFAELLGTNLVSGVFRLS